MKVIKGSAAIFFAVLFTACLRSPVPEAIVPEEFVIVQRHHESVNLHVVRAFKERKGFPCDLTLETFRIALERSLQKSGVFSSIIDKDGADMLLEVTVLEPIRPSPGTTMSSTMITEWRLTRVSDGKMVMEEFVKTSFTGTISDAFVAGNRAALVNENSARLNIIEGIKRISEAELSNL